VTELKIDTGLCPCGSGLRRLRCCDLDTAAIPEAANTALLDGKGQEATNLFNEKKYTEAEALALQVLDVAPNQRLALRVLFEIRKGQNRARPAEVLARRLAALPGPPPMRATANSQLAQYIIGQGRYADALAPAAAALLITPKDATVHHVMGVVLTETGQIQAGERHYQKAMALLGREDPLVLSNLAWNLKLQGRLDEAVLAYEKAQVTRSENKRGIGGYAQVEMARGNSAKAVALLDEAMGRWPNERTLRLLRALADLVLGNPEAVLERLPEPLDDLLAAELCARGQALARQGRPAEAVICYANAKKMMRERSGQTYAPEEFVEKAKAYKAFFTADRLYPLPRAEPEANTPQPVFLLGFPRSGTSLLEQMLASLPGFAPGDEFSPVADLTAWLPRLADSDQPYPEAMDQMLYGYGLDVPAQLRTRYQRARAKLGLARPGVRFITDRTASNPWHLPLIKLLFPQAAIIHVIRHPLDIMLSVLSQDKRMEANAHVSMPAAARHYGLTMDLLKHYRANLTLRYLPVRYEDLAREPASTLRRVLEFIGADPAALPHEATLKANASKLEGPLPAHFAVREALHGRGVFRYREYEAVLPNLFSEVRESLQPWIAELGYGAAP